MGGLLPKRKLVYVLCLSQAVLLLACGPRLKMKRAEDTQAQQGQASNQKVAKKPNPVNPVPGNKPTPTPAPKKDLLDLKALPFKMAKLREGELESDFMPFRKNSTRVLADAQKLSAEDQKFIRYLTTGYHEQLSYKDDQQRAKHKITLIDSISVLLNSLSTGPTIVKPIAIDEGMCIFRIDLRSYRWTAEQYEKVVKGTNFAQPKPYPYTVAGDDNITQLKTLLGTDVPIVRADWFLFEAGKPENYHDLLSIEDTLAKLEQRTQIDRLANINSTMNFPENAPLAIRAGIGRGKSGVSTNNRLIERHKAGFGSFWLSYDFAAPAEGTFRDIFVSPLGPGNVGNVGSLKGFQPAGGEVIFNLPNNLQAYALLDENNGRINIAPTSVVFNPTDRIRAGAITNGYACWSCHSTGLLAAKDEMRPFLQNQLSDAEKASLYGDRATKALNAMHIPQAELDALITSDSKIHNDAVVKARLVGTKPMAQMAWTAQYYENDMTLAMVAAELDMGLAQFSALLPSLPADLQSALHSAKNNDMDRGTFESLFPKLIAAVAQSLKPEGEDQGQGQEQSQEQSQAQDPNQGQQGQG